jgi:HD-GYP domain-containing protein (c-di-GMP phosphodiesterase class II)
MILNWSGKKTFDYLPISPESLRTDMIIGFDVYMPAQTTGSDRYVLYCKDDAVFEDGQKKLLRKKNVNRLFIRKTDEQKYLEYLKFNFQNIISDTRISPDKKAEVVYSATTSLVKDLFRDPKTGNIEKTRKFAYNLVEYIITDHMVANCLLKIAINEYYTYTHAVNVAAVGTLFAEKMGLEVDDLKHFCSGILLHDIGKTRISTDILNKKGKLTEDEFKEIKEHPELGITILKETGIIFKGEYMTTMQHHENYDGTGYPYGLLKDEIHLCGKIARIIDVYDALTTNRSYADAIRPFAALKEMKEKMLNCFDEELFKEFICFLGHYDPRKKRRKGDKLFS